MATEQDKEKQPKQGFSLEGFDMKSYKMTELYVQQIEWLYFQAVQELAKLTTRVNPTLNPDKIFSFDDYPQTKAQVQRMLTELASKMQATLLQGSQNQWLFACDKNDAFVDRVLKTSQLPKQTLVKYQDRNLQALKSFQLRSVNGLDLSRRIWNYTGQMQVQIELAIDVALEKGQSAQELSRELRKYLVDSDKLFRRVADKHGNLKLSKAAQEYKPGQGKYRSSYKNAMRLARSEINMAYSKADQLRWDQLDFVVGYEIMLSNNHTLNGEPFVDICDELVGLYPKWFDWSAKWHPQCRCRRVPVLMSPEEFKTDERNELRAAVRGSEYNKMTSSRTVKDVPPAFKKWIANNAERSKGWKSQPYFIRDNFKNGTIDGGLNG